MSNPKMSPSSNMTEKCIERVNRGDGRWIHMEPCGRDAVTGGLCKLHLRVVNQRVERERKLNAKWEEGKRLQAEAKMLSNILDVYVDAHYSSRGAGGYTGMMVVPLEWLKKLAEEKVSKVGR